MRVRDGDDPADQRDLLAAQAARVAAAVVPLVVAGHGVDHVLELRQLVQEHLADNNVARHGVVFAGGERGRLLEDLVRDDELADIVQEAGDHHRAADLRREVQRAGKLRGVLRD